jgi:dihydroflavonol-4-reductase
MTKIVITGGLGFLGQHVTKTMLETFPNSEVCILARSASSFFLSELNNNRVRVITNTNIVDQKSIENYFKDADYVIHCAATISFWHKDKQKMDEINITGTKNIVDLCLKYGIKRLVHVSSTAAIRGSTIMDEPANETNDYDWKGKSNYDYGLSKYYAEKEVEKGVEAGLDAVIANPCTIVGYGDEKFFPVIETALKGIPFCLSGGSNLIDVRDLVNGIAFLLARGRAGERYLLTGEYHIQKEIMTTLAGILKVRPPMFIISSQILVLALPILMLLDRVSSRRPKLTSTIVRNGLSTSYYSNLKSHKELSWEPKYSLNESFQDTVRYYNEVNK